MFFSHIKAAIAYSPQITMDDGADLISTIHKDYPELCGQIIGSMEETTTGVIRLRAMAKDGALKIPVVAVNDAKPKIYSITAMAPGNPPWMALCAPPMF